MRLVPCVLATSLVALALSGCFGLDEEPTPTRTRLLVLSGFVAHDGRVSATLVPEEPIPQPARCEPYRDGKVHAGDGCDVREGPPGEDHDHAWHVSARWSGSEAGGGNTTAKWREKDVAAFHEHGQRVASWDGGHPDFRLAIE